MSTFLKQKGNPKELPSIDHNLEMVSWSTWGSVPGIGMLSTMSDSNHQAPTIWKVGANVTLLCISIPL